MTILIQFRASLREAIENYENEQARQKKDVPKKYQADIVTLKKILADSETIQEKQNAVLLRQEVDDFLEANIPWLARHVPIFFRDDLYVNIQVVLNRSEYRDVILTSKRTVEDQIERDKINAYQRKILGYLENKQIAGLVQTIEDLENRLEVSEQTALNLRKECNRTQKENEALKAENKRLSAENKRLKEQQGVSPECQSTEKSTTEKPREEGAASYKPPGIFANT